MYFSPKEIEFKKSAEKKRLGFGRILWRKEPKR